MGHLQKIKLCLTAGRYLKIIGVALFAIPAILALPGAFLLAAGYVLGQAGEDAWNIHHRLPKRGPASETLFPWEKKR
jgi:hypothetical protein